MLNPIKYFKARANDRIDKQRREKSISQDEYFAQRIRWINTVKSSLLVYGHDSQFMERASGAIENAARDNVYVCSIIPEGVESFLDGLSANSNFVTVLRTPTEITRGDIIFDMWGAAHWDSKRPTIYHPEENTGVIYRAATIDREYVSSRTKFFREEEAKIREGMVGDGAFGNARC